MAGLEDAPARSAYLGRLIEITTQPLLEMLADNTPQRHLTATLGPPKGTEMGPSNAIICRIADVGRTLILAAPTRLKGVVPGSW